MTRHFPNFPFLSETKISVFAKALPRGLASPPEIAPHFGRTGFWLSLAYLITDSWAEGEGVHGPTTPFIGFDFWLHPTAQYRPVSIWGMLSRWDKHTFMSLDTAYFFCETLCSCCMAGTGCEAASPKSQGNSKTLSQTCTSKWRIDIGNFYKVGRSFYWQHFVQARCAVSAFS